MVWVKSGSPFLNGSSWAKGAYDRFIALICFSTPGARGRPLPRAYVAKPAKPLLIL
jgi:hypothetical protein